MSETQTETTSLVVDEQASTVRLRTFAEGLFAKLAHDLELSCRGIRGTATRTGEDDRAGTVTIEVPIHRIEVAGTVKDGRVDASGLSPSDRTDCLAKMQKDVFHTQSRDAVVRVEATLDGGKARLRVCPPNGKEVERIVMIETRRDGSQVHAKGKFELSLSAIGSDTVKGPMNAFRVKDHIEVAFDVVFATPSG